MIFALLGLGTQVMIKTLNTKGTKIMKGVFIIDCEEILVSPLSKEELKWINRLQRTLQACPPRIEIVTTGDPWLQIISNEKYSELGDGDADRDGVTLANITGKPIVHGVTG